MPIVAEFDIRSPGLALTPTYERVPAASFDLVTEVGTDPERPILFFWAGAPDFAAFEAALEADPTIDETTRYAETERRRLYRAQLSADLETVLYPLWVDLGAQLLHVRREDGWWCFRVRVPSRAVLSEMREWFREEGVEFELERVLDAVEADGEQTLTEAQAETLELALEEGYFEVARDSSLAELGDELGVSPQSVSERLRRGTAALVREHFDGEESV